MCCTRSLATAEEMMAYGPLTNAPHTMSSTMYTAKWVLPNRRRINSCDGGREGGREGGGGGRREGGGEGGGGGDTYFIQGMNMSLLQENSFLAAMVKKTY